MCSKYEETRERKITANLTEIKTTLAGNLEVIIDGLIEVGVIQWRSKDVLDSKSDPNKKIDFILGRILKGPPEYFTRFLKVIDRAGYGFLVDLIQETEIPENIQPFSVMPPVDSCRQTPKRDNEAAASGSYDHNEDTIKQMFQVMCEMKADLKVISEERMSNKEELAIIKRQGEKLSKQITGVEKGVKDVKDENDCKKQLAEERKEFKRQQCESDAEIMQLKQDNEKLLIENESLKSENQTLRQERDKLQGYCNETKSTKKNYQNIGFEAFLCNQLSKDAPSLVQDNILLKSNNDKLRKENKNLKLEIDQLKIRSIPTTGGFLMQKPKVQNMRKNCK